MNFVNHVHNFFNDFFMRFIFLLNKGATVIRDFTVYLVLKLTYQQKRESNYVVMRIVYN